MKPSLFLALHRAAIHRIVGAHHASNPRSVDLISDGATAGKRALAILVDPTARTTVFDIAIIGVEIGKLLGAEVDVLTPATLPPKWRAMIMDNARQV